MLYLKSFCFGPFQENTYILYNQKNEAFIIDPGNSDNSENQELKRFVDEKELKPLRLLLTHGHIDHVMGNRFVFDTWGLLPEVNEQDLFFLENMQQTATMYGLRCEQSPMPERFISAGDEIRLGDYSFSCLYTPGHSPGSISFYNERNRLVIGGDVLFYGSIGRSDLPGGDHETLLRSVREKLFVLPDETKVYSGHGPATSIGFEKTHNPFF